MKTVLITLLSIFTFGSLYAQDGVSGTIYSKADSSKLSFANILIGDGVDGSIANYDGAYSLVNLSDDQIVTFRSIGFKDLVISISNLKLSPDIYLEGSVIELGEVLVNSRELTAKEIIGKVKDRFKTNHQLVETDRTTKVFLHSESKNQFIKKGAELKKSSIDQIDSNFLDTFNSSVPDNLLSYSNLITDIHYRGEESKLKPISAMILDDGLSLEKGSHFELIKKVFTENIEDENSYWKLRTGILGGRVEIGEDQDKLDDYVKHSTLFKKRSIEHLISPMKDGDIRWEFIDKPGKYRYQLDGVDMVGDEVAYRVEFTPKSRGDYQGVIYISSESYAVLQLDCSYAPGKDGVDISLFGISYQEDQSSISVIFQKLGSQFIPKYVRDLSGDRVGVKRDFVLEEKSKRFLFDKSLKKIKIAVDLDIKSTYLTEYLLISQGSESEADFNNIVEEGTVKYRVIDSYDDAAWKEFSVVVPTEEIVNYRKQL